MEKLALLYEDIQLKRMGGKRINRGDISNFLYQITNGGQEDFSVITIRKNDSRTNSSKKAGMEMKVTGRLGSCSATRDKSDYRVPELDTKVQYQKNAILRMCVSSVDGENYITKYPTADRTRSIDVVNIKKVEAGGEIYNIV